MKIKKTKDFGENVLVIFYPSLTGVTKEKRSWWEARVGSYHGPHYAYDKKENLKKMAEDNGLGWVILSVHMDDRLSIRDFYNLPDYNQK